MIFDPYASPALRLKNRIVMAPMTRNRAVDANTPNALMAEYYAQRAGAGLIVTEGTSPSPNGLGYARIPGIYSAAQVEGWKKVTSVVHAKGGHIFIQLMHTGRVSHPANMPEGARILGPSASALLPSGPVPLLLGRFFRSRSNRDVAWVDTRVRAGRMSGFLRFQGLDR
jgi:N-ethylmaleimide reductase